MAQIDPAQPTQQGTGQLANRYRRNEVAPRCLPTATDHKGLLPPLAPPGKGLRPQVELLDQLLAPLSPRFLS